jgi:hypothetical protein
VQLKNPISIEFKNVKLFQFANISLPFRSIDKFNAPFLNFNTHNFIFHNDLHFKTFLPENLNIFIIEFIQTFKQSKFTDIKLHTLIIEVYMGIPIVS